MEYVINGKVSPAELASVFKDSGINRPYQDMERLEKMLNEADLIVTARKHGKLVGVARALTDFCYCCYLSDLAVVKPFQQQGIGSKLISFVRKEIGEETALILLSAAPAMDYYPRAGFSKADNAFIIPRVK
ncbi:GNAT family N-acetyltransferase [Sediminibacillus albus]|uniref:Acetyltransferase (GNAT) domain-containing protein n=1 Tax=Sediminibacillus albus TaxID=407036 RepID=A0A1G9AUC2_9BACI|nr:GNAT family N-acetyltransferase [Sediminibacillus albus]SDK30240.1 Acetyltransferase (GNAT) domain-containing protein [Sediminibacillus albus]